MIKIIDWKINIPFTGYAIQHYHYANGDFSNSSMSDVISKRKPTYSEPEFLPLII